jgi:hypothetical protein
MNISNPCIVWFQAKIHDEGMTLTVFYTPRTVADSGSMSPSAAK